MKAIVLTLSLAIGITLAPGLSPEGVAAPSDALAPTDEAIDFTFDNISLATVIKLVSEITGRNILVQTPITGNVLSYGPQKIHSGEALEMLEIILDSQGYRMMESEDPPLLYVVKKAGAPEELPAASASVPGEGEDSGKDMMPFTFENVQLADVIKTVSERTGKNFLLQTPISGTVLVYCPKMIPVSSLLDMLRIVLDSQGYAMVEIESPPVICVVKRSFLASQPTLLREKLAPTELEVEEAEEVKSPGVPPPPPLQLEVVGVTAMSGGYAAIIRDRSKRFGRGFHEYILREGDEVPGYFGVKVISITPDPPTVKLLRAGVGIEELRMGQQVEKKLTGWEDVVRPVREGSTYLIKLEELKQRIPNAEEYRKTLGLEQVTERGQPKGLRITSLPHDSFLHASGLRQGDVVETINGKRIGDEASALELLKIAAQGVSIQMEITRDRIKRTIIYTLLKK